MKYSKNVKRNLNICLASYLNYFKFTFMQAIRLFQVNKNLISNLQNSFLCNLQLQTSKAFKDCFPNFRVPMHPKTFFNVFPSIYPKNFTSNFILIRTIPLIFDYILHRCLQSQKLVFCFKFSKSFKLKKLICRNSQIFSVISDQKNAVGEK